MATIEMFYRSGAVYHYCGCGQWVCIVIVWLTGLLELLFFWRMAVVLFRLAENVWTMDIGLHCVCMATAFLAACLENLLVAAVCGSRSSGTMGGLLVKQLVKALITTGGGSGTGPGGATTRQGHKHNNDAAFFRGYFVLRLQDLMAWVNVGDPVGVWLD